jgi:hypothetical protein
MLVFFTLFFILFSFWTILFIFNGLMNGVFIMVGIIVSFLVSLFIIKTKLYNERSEFLCLQVGFYKLLVKKIIYSFTENVYLAFRFLGFGNSIVPVVDYILIENDNAIHNALLCGILNLNCGILSCVIKNQCLMVHSIDELFFTPNQLYFLNIEVKNINDDNLV